MTDAPPRHSNARFLMMMPWGRVGSNLLFNFVCESFDVHSIRIENEPFNERPDAEAQSRWLHEFYDGATGEEVFVASKHAMRVVADAGALADFLGARSIALVRIRRANLVKVAVSIMRGRLYAEKMRKETGKPRWGVIRGRQPLPPVSLDAAEFVEVLEEAARLDEALLALEPDSPRYEIEYDVLKIDPVAMAHDLLDWLGVAPQLKVEPRFVKATPDRLADAVPNLGELRDAAKAAGFDAFDAMFEA